MASAARRVLVPAGGAGQGAGHLVRCARLALELGGCDICIDGLDSEARRFLRRMLAGARSAPRLLRGPGRATWDLVILDRRSTTLEELEGFERHGTVVCIDEGGVARRSASYTIDALPRLPGGQEPNAAALSFLDLPAPGRRRRAWPPRKVLVSFGAEDASDLSGAFAAAAIETRLLRAEQLSVLEGPLFPPRRRPDGVQSLVLPPGVRVRDLFGRFDLLVTHFGVTALEALAARLPVILVNPSRYHRRLARAIGIPEMGVREVDVRRLRGLLSGPSAVMAAVDRFAAELERSDSGTLAGHLRMLSRARGLDCPSCGRRGTVVARFPLRTWRRCPDCRLEYVEHLDRRGPAHRARYFFEEYQAHYGRTYLEDFDAIKKAGRARIAIMEEVLRARARDPGDRGGDGAPRGTIVDVGCAYGPFLAALREAGWPCFGVDVSAEAIRYVRGELRLPAARIPLERLERRHLPPGKLQGITLWFVIEHLDDLAAALTRIADLLAPGGLLVFSTPNGRGISWRRNWRAFLEASPADHRFVLSPECLRGLLARHGFRLERVRVTGHHPERFPGILGARAGRSSGARAALLAASRLLGLGDTFEAYAVRLP